MCSVISSDQNLSYELGVKPHHSILPVNRNGIVATNQLFITRRIRFKNGKISFRFTAESQ